MLAFCCRITNKLEYKIRISEKGVYQLRNSMHIKCCVTCEHVSMPTVIGIHGANDCTYVL